MPRPSTLVAAIAAALLSCPAALAGNAGAPPPFAGPPGPVVAPAPLPAPPAPSRPFVGLASAAEAADMLFMREEEKLARDLYILLDEKWGVAPFARIAIGEQMHMDAVLRLLARYRLDDPAAGKTIGEFASTELQALFDDLLRRGSESAVAALEVGGIVEEVDLEDLAAALARSDNADIDQVYEILSCGSRNHLRDFARALERLTGQAYVAKALPQPVVDAILAEPVGNCSRR
jgi:hypothetical protein